MKKTFVLTHPKKKKDRLFDEARRDIKKYIKRESNKELPENFNCWMFDCRFGKSKEDAAVIDFNDIKMNVNKAQSQDFDSFYLEILAKPGNKPPSVFYDRSKEEDKETI